MPRPISRYLLAGGALLIPALPCLAGSVFDDNYVQAKSGKADTQELDNPSSFPTTDEARGTHPVPDHAARADARKTIEEAHAADAKDHSPAGIRKLAIALLDEAKKAPQGSAEQFMLFTSSAQAAEQGHSLRRAFAAIAELASVFQIDELAEKNSAVVRCCASGPTAAVWSVGNVEALLDLSDEAIAAGDLAAIRQIESPLRRASATVADLDLRGEVVEQLRTLAAARETRERIAKDFATLKATPTDSAANLAVGGYLCFLCGNWTAGLPMLTKSGDAELAPLAHAELAHPPDSAEIKALADRWYAAAGKAAPPDRPGIERHAADLYRQALPGLDALEAKLVAQRLAKVPPSRLRRVDLLDLYDPDGSVLRGDWVLGESTLVASPGDYSRVDFLYKPSDEYDFRVGFTLASPPKGPIAEHAFCAGHQFTFQVGGWGNSIAGFEMINGEGADHNKTTRRKDQWLAPGRHYFLILKVRKDGTDAYLGGQLIAQMKTDYQNLDLWGDWHLSRSNNIGIGCSSDAVQFDNAEVVEITGRGEYLNP